MNIAIVGGGKVGYYLAKTLLERGYHPRLIEVDKKRSQRIANELDLTVYYGDGTTIDVLEAAKVGECDTFISVSGKDEDNLIACQLAKRVFGVPRTVARVNNPRNAEVMGKLGVDIPVSATGNIAAIIEREVDTAAIKQLMSLNRGNASISELCLPQSYTRSGVCLRELHVPNEAVIVSISRGEELIIPRGNTQLMAGDRLIVVAENEALGQLSHMFELPN